MEEGEVDKATKEHEFKTYHPNSSLELYVSEQTCPQKTLSTLVAIVCLKRGGRKGGVVSTQVLSLTATAAKHDKFRSGSAYSMYTCRAAVLL